MKLCSSTNVNIFWKCHLLKNAYGYCGQSMNIVRVPRLPSYSNSCAGGNGALSAYQQWGSLRHCSYPEHILINENWNKYWPALSISLLASHETPYLKTGDLIS